MEKRYVAIWFCNLLAERFILHNPELKNQPFALTRAEGGRILIKAVSLQARTLGLSEGMAIADARVIVPQLLNFDYAPTLPGKLLNYLANWCIRYSPLVAVNMPDGIIIDATGCPHIWGGEAEYVQHITARLKQLGFSTKVAMAGTVGAAWGFSRYAVTPCVVSNRLQNEALLTLPAEALRLEPHVLENLYKLGLTRISNLAGIKPSMLRRRFGQGLLLRMRQATGALAEPLQVVTPPRLYEERLPVMEPICTPTGIQIALERLLQALCHSLERQALGLRSCHFICYRIDGNIQQVSIGTNRPSRTPQHLLRLFELKIQTLQPDLGFELFVLTAPVVEEYTAQQHALWDTGNADNLLIAELLDRVAGRVGTTAITAFEPQEQHWPERSVKAVQPLQAQPAGNWPLHLLRPVHLFETPVPITVIVPLPDYPPIQFTFKGVRSQVVNADGPERIEQEWWLSQGLYRDYYCVENEQGERYWLFRLGGYEADKNPQWYVHGIFA